MLAVQEFGTLTTKGMRTFVFKTLRCVLVCLCICLLYASHGIAYNGDAPSPVLFTRYLMALVVATPAFTLP